MISTVADEHFYSDTNYFFKKLNSNHAQHNLTVAEAGEDGVSAYLWIYPTQPVRISSNLTFNNLD